MEIIGQKKARTVARAWKTLPNCVMILGPAKSGKKTLARWIASNFNVRLVMMESGVEAARDLIETAQNLAEPTIFLFSGKGMSASAKNSLLKITEEPPKNCRIMLLGESENDFIGTLASRSIIFQMEPYTPDEIIYYLEKKMGRTNDLPILSGIFSSIGQIESLYRKGGKDLILRYLEKLLFLHHNILEASTSNALKIADWFQYKESDKGDELLDPIVFMELLTNLESYQAKLLRGDNVRRCYAILIRAGECLRDMKMKGRNKLFCINKFIVEVGQIE